MLDITVRPVDQRCYADHLAGWLPSRLIDVHTHVWRKAFVGEETGPVRTAQWPKRVAAENTIEDLLATYRLLLPQQTVTPFIFGMPQREANLDLSNDYVSRVAQQHRLPALLLSTPEWPAAELVRRVQAGGFLGLKPYLSFAPLHIPENDITIGDFLPPSHLEAADACGWMVMLHVPRKARLRDPLNLQNLRDMDRRYPRARVIVAHIGRAYCEPDIGAAFETLKDTENLLFDFSANTNAVVMEQALRALGPRRILFGSDLPILRMRMRRMCEQGIYINLVPPGLYGDVSDDAHMREVDQAQADNLTFFLYEELLAFRRAAEAVGLTTGDLEDVFYRNALRLITKVSP